MIVDAGGGTVDLSTYKFNSTAPITVEEIAPVDCKPFDCLDKTYFVIIFRYIPGVDICQHASTRAIERHVVDLLLFETHSLSTPCILQKNCANRLSETISTYKP